MKAYGFTTTTNDKFLPRVVKETKPRDKFLVVTKRNVVRNMHAVTVLIHRSAMPKAKAGFTLFGKTIGPGIKDWKQIGQFRALTHLTQTPNYDANIAKNELQRVKNYHLNRVVRVEVASV